MSATSRFVRYAPKTARFLLTALSDNLPKARRLVMSLPLSANDGGDGGDYTLSVGAATSAVRGVLKLVGQLGGSADAPDVRGIRVLDATVPTLLNFGEVQDGEALARSGTSVVGVAFVPAGGGTMGGDLNMGGHKVSNLAIGTASGDAATYGQLTSLLNGLDWQNSVLDKLNGPPGSPASGDRYIVGSGTGAWSGHSKSIAQYDGTGWQYFVPNKGWTVHQEAEGHDYNYDGSNWVDLGVSIDHNALLNLGTGNPHTQYQLGSQKDQNSGYAGLDTDGLVNKAIKAIRAGMSDPGSPNAGEVWVNDKALKFRDNSGSPSTQVVEVLSRRNANNGYAGLDINGRIDVAQAAPKSVYSTGGAQGLAPADIGAAAQNRNVSAGVGLSGGGDLTSDRTLSIAAFSGFVSQDHTPSSASWSAHEVKVHATYDIGTGGHLVPSGIRIPACVDAALETQVLFEFHDASSYTLLNTSTGSVLDKTMQELSDILMGSVTGANQNNGRAIRKITFQTHNNSNGSVSSISLGVFRLRAYAFPRGGGSAL
jgi:Protein of unknown function (DUF2793)